MTIARHKGINSLETCARIIQLANLQPLLQPRDKIRNLRNENLSVRQQVFENMARSHRLSPGSFTLVKHSITGKTCRLRRTRRTLCGRTVRIKDLENATILEPGQ